MVRGLIRRGGFGGGREEGGCYFLRVELDPSAYHHWNGIKSSYDTIERGCSPPPVSTKMAILSFSLSRISFDPPHNPEEVELDPLVLTDSRSFRVVCCSLVKAGDITVIKDHTFAWKHLA